MNRVKFCCFLLSMCLLCTLWGCTPTPAPTPQTPTNVSSRGSWVAESAPLVAELQITEALPSNSQIAPLGGKYYDLVEIQNVSTHGVNLLGYTLTDKKKELERYAFPNVTLQPGECYVVYCSGAPSLGENHAPFKLGLAKGEQLILAKNGQAVDTLTLPSDLQENISYGRAGETLQYFYTPTLGKPNGQGVTALVAPPTANLPAGVYDTHQTVSLKGEGTIYYTLNGTQPTQKSKVYSTPILVKGVTTIRAICVNNQKESSQAAFTYVVGNHTLPVVTIAIQKDKLQGEKGILNHIDKTYEYQCQLTLLEQGKQQFSLPCGFRLHGNGSREMPKQNFQLRFRSKYGASKLEYPLFENRPFTSYNSLLLKGGSEDWGAAVMRDEVATTALEGATALYLQAYKPVVLYLAGEYWGVYYLRERFSDDYVASHFQVPEESVDLLTSTDGYVQSGSSKAFDQLKQYVKTHDMKQDEHYEYLCSQIDVNSLMDWYICRSYMGDKDLANIRRFRSEKGDGKWRWMYFDLDWAFYLDKDKPIKDIVENANGEPILIQGLLAHKKGQDAFLKRYAHLMKTVLNAQHMEQVTNTIAGQVASEMPADRARWGRSLSGWETAVKNIKAYFEKGKRDARVKGDLQSYFSLTDAQMQAYFS